MKPTSFKRKMLQNIPFISRFVNTLEDRNRALEEQKRVLEDRNRALEDQNRALEDQSLKLKECIAHPILLSRNKDTQADPSGQSEDNGLPLPPALLRGWVAGIEDLSWFLEGGKLGAQTILSILAKQDIEFEKLESVLDFGCGCGRVMRHLQPYEVVRLHGTDCNQVAIAWSDEKLNFAEFCTNPLEPPTRYRRHSFDLIYAFSVFTHLTESLQASWMQELRRILKPNGLLIITVHGDHYIPQIPVSGQAKYRNGELVVIDEEVNGQNQCGAFHPESYVRNILAKDFEVLSFYPEGALGNPKQDVYLLKVR